MRLTIITITLALAALTACNPLDTPPILDRAEVTVNGGVCDPAVEGECSVPAETVPTDPNAPCLPEGGVPCFEGGEPIPTTTAVPPTPNVCLPGEVEGGVTC